MTFVQQREPAADTTINATAYRQIRNDIVSCKLMPNERLRVEALRDRYSIGGSPIREALMRLEAEGLVVLEQNKGFRVSPVSRQHLFDLTKTRLEVEATALRWSIEQGGVEWEADLLGAFHRLSHQKKIERGGDTSVNAAWFNEHRNFHSALVAACNSPTLKAIREGLFAQAERYFALSIMSKLQPRNDAAEHEQIMRAALARNVARAIQLHNAHIERTTEKVAKSLEAGARTLRLRTSNGKAVK